MQQPPENIPASRALLMLTIGVSIMLGCIIPMTTTNHLEINILSHFLDIAILAFFTYFLLAIYQKRTRFLQTFIALLAIKLMLQILIWPYLLLVGDIGLDMPQNNVTVLVGIVLMILLIFTLISISHVLASALNVNKQIAGLYSFIYYLVNIYFFSLLFVKQHG